MNVRPVILLRTLGIGIAAGLAAHGMGMPLAWMLGPMIGITCVATAGVPVFQPNVLPAIALPVVGVMLGSRVTAELLANAANFATALLFLVPFVICCAGLSYLFYRRVGKFDPATAFFAGMPGGLNDMVILGGEMGADEKRISLAHAVRILLVIGLVAAYFGVFLDVRSSDMNANWLPVLGLSVKDAALLAGAALIGIPLGRALRLPAPQMLGPMILSGILHVTELVTVPPPTLLVIAAQIVLGIRIGARFAGVSYRFVATNLALGTVSSVIMIGVALVFAALASRATDIDIAQTFLAYSPGGLIELSLLALALGQEAAFVTLAHVVRIVLVIFGAPVALRIWRSKG